MVIVMGKHSKRVGDHIKASYKNKRATTVVYMVLLFLVLAGLAASIITHEWQHTYTYALTLILFMLPSLAERHFRFELPSAFEIIVICFIFAAQVLGEINSFYVKIPMWDTILHTISGFIFAGLGFALVDIFNRNARFKFLLSPFFVALTAFCFAMTIGGLWELFEFACDRLLGVDMQKDTYVDSISSVLMNHLQENDPIIIEGITGVLIQTEAGEAYLFDAYIDLGIIDTMEDLFVNLIGAVVFCIFGYIYVQGNGGGEFVSHFIPVVSDELPEEKILEEKPEPQPQPRPEPQPEPSVPAPARERYPMMIRAVSDLELPTKTRKVAPVRSARIYPKCAPGVKPIEIPTVKPIPIETLRCRPSRRVKPTSSDALAVKPQRSGDDQNNNG